MSDYPLSARSSKKTRPPPPHQPPLPSPLRSTCPLPSDYSTILQGQRIFIELYSQGKVVSTEYSKWVQAMGATLHQRLNSTVTVFLTNLEGKEAAGVMERVKKVGGECKVVSILWLEECFREKKKVEMEQFQITEEVEEVTNVETFEELNSFLENVGEDVRHEFKEALRKQGKRFFIFLPKTHCCPAFRLLSNQQVELSDRKGRHKMEGDERRRSRKSSARVSNKVGNSSQVSEVESEVPTECVEKSMERRQEIVEEKEDMNVSRRMSLEDLMEKYLGKEKKVEQEQTITIKAKLTPVLSVKSPFTRSRAKKAATQPQSFTQIEETPSQKRHSQKPVTPTNTQADVFITPISKSKKRQTCNEEDTRTLGNTQQLAMVSKIIKQKSDHTLIIVTTSSIIETRVNKVNKATEHPQCIFFKNIQYTWYLAFLSENDSYPHQTYFFIDSYKVTDRMYYYALTLASKFHPILVSTRLINEVQQINFKIKTGKITTPKLDSSHLLHLNPIKLKVKKHLIKGKHVAVLQSDVQLSIWRLAIESLEGFWVTKQEYLEGKRTNLVVSNRWLMKQKEKQTYIQTELLKKLLELDE